MQLIFWTFATTAAFFFASSSLSSAQFIPTAATSVFPACGLQCQNVLQAQTSCASISTRPLQVQCFCQYGPLNTWYSQSSGVCDAVCPNTSDQNLLQSWFKAFCASGGSNENGAASTSSQQTTLATSTTGAPTIVVPTSSSGTAAQATASPVGTASTDASTGNHQGWFTTHWRWVLMLGVLAVGLVLFAILLIFFKRRHARKVEARRAAASGFPVNKDGVIRDNTASRGQDMWGPHQHMAHTRGWEYNHDQEAAGAAVGGTGKKRNKKLRRGGSKNGKTREMADVREEDQPRGHRIKAKTGGRIEEVPDKEVKI